MSQYDWKIVLTKQADKDLRIAIQNGFREKILSLFKILVKNPFELYPSYEKLTGNLSKYKKQKTNSSFLSN